ncbi:MAG: YdcF family protein [Hymenobacteraceae bacterium]|nr:YdcF family protein [Hymenobacteraceae bacterium]
MFFLLSKLLVFVLSPVLWVVVGLGLALAARTPPRRRAWLRATTAALLVLSNPGLANLAWNLWEAPLVPVEGIRPGSYDAAVLLTGITAPARPPYDRVFVADGADRLLHTVQLWRRGAFRRIIVSGGSGAGLRRADGRSEAAELRGILRTCGVPDSAIVLEDRSRNTCENATFTAALLRHRPTLAPRGRLLLITSAFHLPRAAGCFRRAGLPVAVFPAHFYGQPARLTPDALVVPSAAALLGWDRLLHELVGYLTYRLAGYC